MTITQIMFNLNYLNRVLTSLEIYCQSNLPELKISIDLTTPCKLANGDRNPSIICLYIQYFMTFPKRIIDLLFFWSY